MLPRGVPGGLDADTSRRVLRSLLLVRIIRGILLLVFLVTGAAAVELRRWPSAVAFVLGVAILVQAGALAAWCRRYTNTAKDSGAGSSP